MRPIHRLKTLFALVVSLVTTSAAAANVIHTEKSLYRNILIYEEGGQRCMSFSRREQSTRQTCKSLSDPDEFVFTYTKMMMGALYLNPDPHRILIIGLGGGVLPTALAAIYPDAAIDIVEIDPAVVRVAKQFFGFNPSAKIRVIEEDGRVFAKRAGQADGRYDLIMLDAFDHQYIPEHLLTQEFLLEIKKLLTTDGVLAANTFSTSQLYDHESTTYQSVFGDFYNLRVQWKNRIILAKLSGLPGREALETHAAALESKLQALGFGRDWLLPLFSTKPDWKANARVLTDQYSPSNLLNSVF